MTTYTALTTTTGREVAEGLATALEALQPEPHGHRRLRGRGRLGPVEVGGLFRRAARTAPGWRCWQRCMAPRISPSRSAGHRLGRPCAARADPGRGRALLRLRQPRCRQGAGRPRRPADRGGDGLRHRPSRHDAGLPAGASTGWSTRHDAAERIADIGCGTAVLAMAAARVWPEGRGHRRRHRSAGGRGRDGKRDGERAGRPDPLRRGGRASTTPSFRRRRPST